MGVAEARPAIAAVSAAPITILVFSFMDIPWLQKKPRDVVKVIDVATIARISQVHAGGLGSLRIFLRGST
jgi:hypothetical protein